MPSWLWRSSARAFAITALTLTTPPIANTQTEEQKFPGKIVCGAFSGDPRKYPAWNDEMQISINRGRLIATPSLPQGQVMTGIVAASGAVLVAGEGGLPGQPPEWTYEFSGQFNPKGQTILRGRLANIMGGGATRSCAISF